MKFGLLKYSTYNIGDDIQSIAARDLLPSVDVYLDRDKLEYVDDDTVVMILNGWFTGNPGAWPPPAKIEPLIISFHITHMHKASQLMLGEESLQYFRKHEPIGCRDLWTMNLLQSKGIDCFFSGCLTLTLERQRKSSDQNIVFVDAFHRMPTGFEAYFLDNKIPNKFKGAVEKCTHWDLNLGTDHLRRFARADELLDKYANASLVVTSRIHCLLPCLAFGTPVYFIDYGYLTEEERNRFGGLLELVDVIRVSDMGRLGRKLRRFAFPKLGFEQMSSQILAQLDWEKDGNSRQEDILILKDKLKSQVREYLKNMRS